MEDQDSLFMDKCELTGVFDEEWMSEMLDDDFQISFPDELMNSPCSTPTQLTPTLPPLPPQTLTIEQTKKHDTPKRYNNLEFQPTLTRPVILNFDNRNNPSVNLKNSDKVRKVGKGTRIIRHRSETYDHITSERKRRELLTQSFTVLSTMVPGLKKTDKTSVLTDAIEYVKELQEKAKILEKQTTKHTIESVVLVTKSEENNECNARQDDSSDHFPEINARFSYKSVLMRILCEKRKGVLGKILSQIEKMNVTIHNTSISPFGNLALDVTVIAEMEEEFDMTLEDFLKNLRLNVLRQIRPNLRVGGN